MKWLAYVLITICILNWVISGALAVKLGGDAVRGKVEDGKYFVGHGSSYTEVSKSTYEYSRLHTYSFWATHALGMIGGFYLVIKHNRENADTYPRNP